MSHKATTTDALQIIDKLFFDGDPEMEALLDDARERLSISLQIHDARVAAGLTQAELAARIGTSRSVIARIEQNFYEKHTLSTLRKVAAALGHRVSVELVPMEVYERKKKTASRKSASAPPKPKATAKKRAPVKATAK